MDKSFVSSHLDELAACFSYKERVVKRIKDMAEKRSASIHMGYYNIDKVLKRCYEFISEDKPEMVFTQIIENGSEFLEAINTFRGKNLEEDEPIQITIFNILKKIRKIYFGYAENAINENIIKFKNTWLFTEEELSNRLIFDPRRMIYVENAIKEKLFKLYSYRKGNGRVNTNTPFRIYPTIGISHSLEEWFQFLDKQDIVTHDSSAVVTLFLHLDYASDHYASFIISVHQEDSIWIASDQLDFDNPRNKYSRRKPERDKERHYETVSLPYEILDELTELRQKNTALVSSNHIETIEIDAEKESDYVQAIIDQEDAESARIAKSLGKTFSKFGRYSNEYKHKKTAILVSQRILNEKNIAFKGNKESLYRGQDDVASSFFIEGRNVAVVSYDRKKYDNPILTIYKSAEILQKAIKEIHPYDKMYFVLLVERLFEELNFEPDRETVMLSSQFLNQKLLTGEQFHANEDGFRYYGDEAKVVVSEVIDATGATETAITTFSYLPVLNSRHYEANWLGTPKSLNNLLRWTVLEDQAENIKNKIEAELKPRKEIDSEKLQQLLANNISEIHKIAFTYNNDYIINKYDTFNTVPKASKMHFISRNKDGFEKSWPEFRVGKGKGWRESDLRCQICNNNKVYKQRPLIIFRINHYEQLLLLTGLKDKKQLPAYFQSFRSHNMIPYLGNSILDNIHPYLMIKDPASRVWPNGIEIAVYMCRACYLKLQKQYSYRVLEEQELLISYLLKEAKLDPENYRDYILNTIERFSASEKLNYHLSLDDKNLVKKLLKILKK